MNAADTPSTAGSTGESPQGADAWPHGQDVSIAYATWTGKGAITQGRRLTLLTPHRRVRVGDEVLVFHVAEAVDASAVVYTMGPKPIAGESVDGNVAHAPAADVGDDPFKPTGIYDGPVVGGPAVDVGFETSSYRFDAPGTHRIQWRLGRLVSNELIVVVD